MSPDPDHSHHVRRVTLPSGRSIDVVYFDAAPPAPAPDPGRVEPTRDRRRSRSEDLHLCASCEAAMVYPLDWEEVSRTQWEVQLRCPNCEWHHVGIYDQDVVDRFDDELDRATATVVRDLRRLTRANMEEEVERFVAALESDAVWPMDF